MRFGEQRAEGRRGESESSARRSARSLRARVREHSYAYAYAWSTRVGSFRLSAQLPRGARARS